MKILSLIIFLCTNTSYGWELVRDNEGTYLSDNVFNVKEKIFAFSSTKTVEPIIYSNDIIILRYLESYSGTKYLTKTYNCSIYNTQLKKFIVKDILCKSISTFADGKQEEETAQFVLDDKNLNYSFEEISESFTIK